MMKTNLRYGILLFLVLCSLACQGKESRPNIIIILSDDHSASAMSAAGSQIVHTPNLDRLAESGRRFTNAFAVNSLCGPSRASLITGAYNAHNGFKRNRDVLSQEIVTFPEQLQKAGYANAVFGKWHLNSPPRGYDDYRLVHGQGAYEDPFLKSPDQDWDGKNSTATRATGYSTEIFTDLSIEWLSKQDGNQPFCMEIHYKTPHAPHIYPERFDNYLQCSLEEPPTLYDDYMGRDVLLKEKASYSKLNNMLKFDLQTVIPNGLNEREQRSFVYQSFFRGYYRMVACLDEQIGRLLTFIDFQPWADNTVVIYASDNGFFLGDHGLYNKMWMYEESLRIPLIVRWSGHVAEGTLSEAFVSMIDLAPTLVDLADGKIPDTFQGRSLRPLLEGDGQAPDDWRDTHYYHYYGQFEVPEHRGIRTDRYKLIEFEPTSERQESTLELYDLKNDPQELLNRANDPEYTSILSTLQAKLETARKQFDGE